MRLFFYFRAYAQLPGQLLTSRLFVRRGSDRAALATSLYGSSAFEYAAGFFLSWTVPGPLAAHAAREVKSAAAVGNTAALRVSAEVLAVLGVKVEPSDS